jgi:hypothetical protein
MVAVRGGFGVAFIALGLVLGAACSSFGSSENGDSSPDVRDAASESPACAADLSSDPKNCGSCGHDCRGSACAQGTCAVEIVASEQAAPFGIALDEGNVYFTNKTTSGTVVSCQKSGCGATPVVLADNQNDPYGIAVDAAVVYWTSPGDSAIRGVVKAGGAPTTLRSGGTPTALLQRGGMLYWVDPTGGGGGGSVESCAATGCAPGFSLIFQTEIFGLAVLEPNVYWTAGTTASYVATCPPCPGYNQPPFVVANGLAYQFAQGLAVDDTNLYIAARADNGVILTIPRTASSDGGAVAPTTLASDLVNPFAVVADENYVFFTTRGTPTGSDGTVMRVDKTGANLTPLAKQQAFPAWLAVDADYVYWTNTAGGTVARTRKK